MFGHTTFTKFTNRYVLTLLYLKSWIKLTLEEKIPFFQRHLWWADLGLPRYIFPVNANPTGPRHDPAADGKIYLLCNLVYLAPAVHAIGFPTLGGRDDQSAFECGPSFYPCELFCAPQLATGACGVRRRYGGRAVMGRVAGPQTEKSVARTMRGWHRD